MPAPSEFGDLADNIHDQVSPSRTQITPAGRCETTSECALPRQTRSLTGDSHTLIKVLGLLVAGACPMAALLSLLPAAGHDQLWFLLVARRWLAGATLYGSQIFDSNTPAVVWLSAVPVTLAERLHGSDVGVAKFLVVLLEAAVAALSLRLLRCLAPLALTLAQVLWLAFCFIVIFACAPARDLGQRDQLTALLCLPYVLAAAADVRSLSPFAPLRFAAGTLAAVGVCLKPQQALIPLAIELALLLRANLRSPYFGGVPQGPAPREDTGAPIGAATGGATRRLVSLRRPEPWLILCLGLAFVTAVHDFAPLFFTLTLPTLLSTYWAIGHLSRAQLLVQAPQLHLLGLLATTLFLTRRPRSQPLRYASALLFVAGAAATVGYYLQGTGWYYQQLPAISLFAAAFALELLPFVRPRTLPHWLPLATAALVLLALGLTIHFGGLALTHNAAYATTEPDPALFTGLTPGTPVAILTTSVEDSMMPVERFHLTWAQRTNNLWTLPAILRQSNPSALAPRHRLSPARLAQLSAQQRQWMQEDLLRWHPTLLLAERCTNPQDPCQNLEGLEASPALNHDLLTFFLADPALRTLLTRHYRLTRSTPAYNAYTLTTPF